MFQFFYYLFYSHKFNQIDPNFSLLYLKQVFEIHVFFVCHPVYGYIQINKIHIFIPNALHVYEIYTIYMHTFLYIYMIDSEVIYKYDRKYVYLEV